MYIDWTYIVLICPALLLSFIASSMVKSRFSRYSKQFSRRGLTAAEATERVLRAHGLANVRVLQVGGELTDHYDPKDNVIRLSDSVYASTSTAAIGVACHEAGHAIQYAEGYGPIKLRSSLVTVTNFGAKLSGPLIVGGFFLAGLSEIFIVLAYAGVICFALSAFFQLVTLPVEFDASRRAMREIEGLGLLYEDETKGVKSVLTAAALTYVAALLVSLMQLLRFILILSRRRD